MRTANKRVITLDRQFRTHPTLGRFISEQFYEPSGEHVENGIDDPALFTHGLPSTAAPLADGSTCRTRPGVNAATGTSICRPVGGRSGRSRARRCPAGIRRTHVRSHHLLHGTGRRDLASHGCRRAGSQEQPRPVGHQPRPALAPHGTRTPESSHRHSGRVSGTGVRRRLSLDSQIEQARRPQSESHTDSSSCPTA